MFTRMFKLSFVVVMVLGLLPGLAVAQAPESPEAAALAFYEWYLDYAGYDEEADTMQNPLVDGAYRDSAYLSADLVARMDALLAEGPGYDPFLCAQDIPAHVAVEAIVAGEEAASVLVRLFFGGNPQSHNLMADMIREEGAWRIDAITCEDTVTPRGVVDSFYRWYLNYAEQSNPLADAAYRDSAFLTADFIAAVDALGEGGFMADPFLCAQDLPRGVQLFEGGIVDDTAMIAARMAFGGDADPMAWITLSEGADGWQIDEIACGLDPAAVTQLVYTQYALHVRHDMAYGIGYDWIENPAFPWTRFVSAEALALFHSAEPLPADPVLCAQDVPAYFMIEVYAVGDGEATVPLMGAFAAGPDTFSLTSLADVTLAESGGAWQITDIACTP